MVCNLNPDLYFAGPLEKYRPKVLNFVASIHVVCSCEMHPKEFFQKKDQSFQVAYFLKKKKQFLFLTHVHPLNERKRQDTR